LWLFGAILTLVGATTVFPGTWFDRENNDQWIKIKLSEYTTLRIPGADVTIDFTAPEGVRITTPDRTSWRELRDLMDLLDREVSINLWPVLIEFAMILACLLLLGVFARYVAETAVIRMVDETAQTGRRLSVWEGLRRGISIRAGRLFMLDLAVGVLAAVAIIIMFGLALAPSLLAIGSHNAVLITAGVGTVGLIILGFYLWLAASAVLSLVMQPIRRLCVLEDQSLLAAIRQGFSMVINHLKEVGLLWLVWMGIRLLWLPISGLIAIFLAPVLLLTMLAGVALGGVSTVLVAAIFSLFIGGITAWIMGALAGLPVFIVMLASPMLFISGLVEVYKSSLWTLAYRDLITMECPVQVPASKPRLASAQGAAD
jgi:hypothetical protein